MNVTEMKNIDATKADAVKLTGIKEKTVDCYIEKHSQLQEFIRQIKNPYCYNHDESIVKIDFENTGATLIDRLQALILKVADPA